MLGIPDNVDTFAMMAIGYPLGKFGPLVRRPVAEVACVHRSVGHTRGQVCRRSEPALCVSEIQMGARRSCVARAKPGAARHEASAKLFAL